MKAHFLLAATLFLLSALGCDSSRLNIDELSVVSDGEMESSATKPASISVVDYFGRTVELPSPANRIVALSPHIVENLFSVGAGRKIVAVVNFSDFPEQARSLPSLGSFNQISVEAIVAARPDLVVGWATGSKDFAATLKALEASGIPVYVDEPRSLEDIARSLLDLGQLAGTISEAERQVGKLRQELKQLREQYQAKTPINVFYQIWNKPLQTLNGEHIVSDILHACGAINIFDDVSVLAPIVNIETVIEENPQAIIASISQEMDDSWLEDWKSWPQVEAVRDNHLYGVRAEWLSRQTLRMLLGAKQLCQHIDQVRGY